MRSLVVLTCLALALWTLPAAAQDFAVENTVNTIHVGTSPESAVISSDGRQLYVANRGGRDISVIDTATGRVSSIPVGASPHGLLLSHDGSRLYALIGGDDPDAALAIIDTASQIVAQHITIPRRTDAMVLTPDDRRLYLARVYFGVSSLDVDSGQQEPVTVIPGTCPIGIAISKNGQKLFVNYQCYGPLGWLAHDSIVEYALPSYQRTIIRNDLANIGDQLAISPDGTELWATGADACSRPDYNHAGCPSFPSRIVNVLRVSDDPSQDMQVLKSIGFSISDSNGRISFSPGGDAFVGGGIELKQVNTRSLDSIHQIHIASAGDVVFSPDGNIAYITVKEKGVVEVLARGKLGNQGIRDSAAALSPEAAATLVTVECGPDLERLRECNSKFCRDQLENIARQLRISSVSTLNNQDLVGQILAAQKGKVGCASPFGGTGVQPQMSDDTLRTRGVEQPGQPVAKMESGADVYCFIAERLRPDADLQQLLQAEDRKKVEEYRDFTVKPVNSPDGNEAFFDVTGRLQQDPTVLQKALGKSAVYLSTVVCPNPRGHDSDSPGR
jgi:YVTN family beta-propeller protein